MLFQDFKQCFFDQIVFHSNQVYAWYPGFDKNNLSRWVGKGYLVRLRNGFYIFREHTNKQNIALYIANRIYKPSYVSLHTALAFYGLIPESVPQTISVAALKTAQFKNRTGTYSYKSIKNSLLFGFQQLPFQQDRSLLIASPEKAILDLLYLYPFYNSVKELEELRLDEDSLKETVNWNQLQNHLDKMKSKALNTRVKLLLELYNLSL